MLCSFTFGVIASVLFRSRGSNLNFSITFNHNAVNTISNTSNFMSSNVNFQQQNRVQHSLSLNSSRGRVSLASWFDALRASPIGLPLLLGAAFSVYEFVKFRRRAQSIEVDSSIEKNKKNKL